VHGKSTAVACRTQPEAAKPKLLDCTGKLKPTATVAQLEPSTNAGQFATCLLHIIEFASLQACLRYNCKLSLIAVLQYLRHLLCGLGFQS